MLLGFRTVLRLFVSIRMRFLHPAARFPGVFFFAAMCCVSPVAMAANRPAAQQPPETVPVFEFHSGFWVNLHHFLYLQGRARNLAKEPATPATLADRQDFPAAASTDGLTAEQLRAWNAAVDAYAADWSVRDLQLNIDMAVVNNRLGELENCADISGKNRVECKADLRADLMTALEEAAPVYRAKWWNEQDRANRTWIAAVAPLVRRMGVGVSEQLAMIYQTAWPREATRVDVVWSIGPLGAYTTLNPVHVTVASGDPRNQGPASFEVLFHEASHALAGELNQAIALECRQEGKPIPRELWHAVLYYTAGEITRRMYAQSSRFSGGGTGSDYTSYADRNGLYDKDWNQYRTVLDLYWQPYLDGKASFDKAIARMIAAL
jgi:hypothetical protein